MPESSFERIHNIHPRFNRIFSIPIYVVSTLIVFVLFVSPYSLRLVIAFLINLFMNRPRVYLALFSEKIGRPVNLLLFRTLYFSIFAVYAIAYQTLSRQSGPPVSTWVESKRSENELEDLRFQS